MPQKKSSKSSGTSTTSSLTSDDSSVPKLILHGGKSPNFIQFREALESVLLTKYGQQSQFISTGKAYVPAEILDPAPDAFTVGNDPFGRARKTFEKRIEVREQLLNNLEQNSAKIFGEIWSNLSAESQQRVQEVSMVSSDLQDLRNHLANAEANLSAATRTFASLPVTATAATRTRSANQITVAQETRDEAYDAVQAAAQPVNDWPEVRIAADPIRLWARVLQTHLAVDTGVSIVNQKEARTKYGSVKQGATESLVSYKQRFEDALKGLNAVGAIPTPDSDQAVDFITGLDSNRYVDLKVQLQTELTGGYGTYPPNLGKAFERSSLHTIVTNDGKAQLASMFLTGAKSTKKKGQRKDFSETKSQPSSTEKPSTNSGGDKKKDNSKQKKNNKQPSRPCSLCQEAHWDRDCPMLKEFIDKKKTGKIHLTFSRATVSVDGSVTNMSEVCEEVAITLPAGSLYLSPTDVLLDNQATQSIVRNSDILVNISKADIPCLFSGISGEPLHVDQDGILPGLGRVYYHPDAAANVISWSKTEEQGYVNGYDQERGAFFANSPNGTTRWFPKNSDGLYAHDFSKPSHVFAVQTVQSIRKELSHRERKQVDKVHELYHRLGYPGTPALHDTLTVGGILEVPVTAHDVARTHDAMGPVLANIRGKTVKHASIPSKIDFLPRHIVSDLVLDVDIMFVNTCAFLFSVAENIGNTIVTELGRTRGSRSTPSLRKALFDQIAQYKGRKFNIKAIQCDGEGGIAALEQELLSAGILFNPAGPGQHVGPIERKIRDVKGRCRGIVNTLLFPLAALLIGWLVVFCVSRINMMVHKTGYSNLSPFEIFSRRKVSYKIDLRCGFMDYVEATVPVTDNTMQSRTTPCLTLYPTGNTTGSVKMWSLASKRVITRDQFKILPMPDSIINEMKNFAETYRLPPEEDLDFTRDGMALADEPVLPFKPLLNDNVVDINETLPIDISVEPMVDSIDTEPDPQPPYINEPHVLNDTEPVIINADSVNAHPLDDPAVVIADKPPPAYSLRSANRHDGRKWTAYGVRVPSTQGTGTTEAVLVGVHEYCYHISLKTALSDMKDRALSSIYDECQQMHNKKVFRPVNHLPTMKKPIRSFLFLKEKYTADGVWERLKSRLVAGGNFQDLSEYNMFTDITSPTASVSSLFMVAAIAAKEHRIVRVIDITGAYLNASMKHQDVFMVLDPVVIAVMCNIDPTYRNFVRHDGTVIVGLEKALYGCVESARLWYDTLVSTLESIGYVRNPLDKCVFNKTIDGQQCTIVVYVDDFFVASTNIALADEVDLVLREKFKDITVKSGNNHSYLGMNWDFSIPGEVKVTMEGYINDLLEHTKTLGTSATPAANNLFDVRDATKLDDKQKADFHSYMAKVLYLAKRARPDVLLPISFLSTRVQSPDTDDWKKLERVLKYLSGTKEMGIVLRPDDELSLEAHIDASYGVHEDGKSHSGMHLSLGLGAFFVKSSKQKIVTKSSTEAELVALSDMCSTVLWSREFLIAQGYDMPPAKVYQDNQSTMALIDRGESHSERTRHIKIRYFWVKDNVDSGDLEIIYQPTDDMIADVLTKPLQGDKFLRMRSLLLNWNY